MPAATASPSNFIHSPYFDTSHETTRTHTEQERLFDISFAPAETCTGVNEVRELSTGATTKGPTITGRSSADWIGLDWTVVVVLCPPTPAGVLANVTSSSPQSSRRGYQFVDNYFVRVLGGRAAWELPPGAVGATKLAVRCGWMEWMGWVRQNALAPLFLLLSFAVR